MVNYSVEDGKRGGGHMVIAVTASIGHPTQGVFMKCWRCQGIRCLMDDGNGGLRCPQCRELLIPLEDPAPLKQEVAKRIA
jgi:hypothetical protein